MHALPLPLLELLITHLIGLRPLKLISKDSVLWFLKTLPLYRFMFVTVPHRPVQVILPFWIPMLRIWFWCLLAIVFHHDQFQFIGNLLGGLKRLSCSKGPGIVVWSEAGCPSSGVLSQIKKHAKARREKITRSKRMSIENFL